MDIGPANAEAFCDKSVLPTIPDGEICIGIGDIIKISANDSRMRAFIQLCAYLFGLVSPPAKSIAKLFCDGSGSLENTIVDLLDDLDVMKVLCPEED